MVATLFDNLTHLADRGAGWVEKKMDLPKVLTIGLVGITGSLIFAGFLSTLLSAVLGTLIGHLFSSIFSFVSIFLTIAVMYRLSKKGGGENSFFVGGGQVVSGRPSASPINQQPRTSGREPWQGQSYTVRSGRQPS